MTLVWYRLVIIGDDAESNSTVNDNIEERNRPDDHIIMTTNDFTISEMKKAVKKECEPHLNYLAPRQLQVYRPGTAASVPDGTVPCPIGSNVSDHATTPDNGYIVVAPSRARESQQAQDGK